METIDVKQIETTGKAIKGFITEVKKDDNIAIYRAVKTDFRKFMKNQGISEDVLKQVSDATNLYVNGAVSAAKDLLIDNGVSKSVIRTRTDIGRIDVEYNAKYEGTNPRTGEKSIKYGSVSIKMRNKTILNEDALKKYEDEVKAIFAPKTLKKAA